MAGGNAQKVALWSSLTVVKLKEVLRKNELSVVGAKAALIQRLIDAGVELPDVPGGPSSGGGKDVADETPSVESTKHETKQDVEEEAPVAALPSKPAVTRKRQRYSKDSAGKSKKIPHKETETAQIEGDAAALPEKPLPMEPKSVEPKSAEPKSVEPKSSEPDQGDVIPSGVPEVEDTAVKGSDLEKAEEKQKGATPEQPESEQNALESHGQPPTYNLPAEQRSVIDTKPAAEEPYTQPSESNTTIVIRNLTRPLTLETINEELSSQGEILHFWIDRLRTHCFVTYANEQQASSARDKYDGLKYPPGIGKVLSCEFTTRENADKEIAKAENSQPTGRVPVVPPPHISKGFSARQQRTSPVLSQHRKFASQQHTVQSPTYIVPSLTSNSRPNTTIFRKSVAVPHIYYSLSPSYRLASKESRGSRASWKPKHRDSHSRSLSSHRSKSNPLNHRRD